MLRFHLVLAVAFLGSPVQGQQTRAMQIDDLFGFSRISDPQISPDGQWVVYTQGTVHLDDNKVVSRLYLASLTRPNEVKALTQSIRSDRHPRWSPDSKSILFESSRSGSSQLWIIDLGGGEARQLTSIATGASSAIWSRDGKQIAFVSAVWPEHSTKPYQESNAANKRRMDENDKNPVKAKVFSKLFFRHWDDYVEDKRQHLFVCDFADGQAGEPRDVTPGDRDAYPTSSTFSSGDDFTFSPNGKYLLFSAVPEKEEAWSTNYDICRVPTDKGSSTWETLTTENPAADSAPQFSPDGKKLAWRVQQRPGFEADRWQVVIADCDENGKAAAAPTSATKSWDRSVDAYVWETSGTLLATADDNARASLFRITPGNPEVQMVVRGGQVTSPTVDASGAKMAFAMARMTHPSAVFTFGGKGQGPEGAKPAQVSTANERILRQLDLPAPESVTVKVEGAEMQMWILKPPGFDASKKWPLAFLVHGGPQGAWEDGWSFRWCPQLWAAQGYVVALPNPRGSTGFGQKFVDEISGDWGGKCYDDLMAGLAYLEKQPYVDPERMGAAGASFGGYMMNWFQGKTRKFKTLINHCGVFNFESMYATTEELWFDEWEHGGPPWGKSRHSYEKHSPHRLAQNFATPMLIIHNDLDFRVPVAEGIQAFTTMQRLGIPTRFVNFPDEGHWVLKPRNSQFWHREVFAWLKKYVPPGPR